MSEITVSCSNGSIAHDHDRRYSIQKNVDTVLSKDNVKLFDELEHTTLTTFINQLMQPYIDEYNAKQKKPSRRINETYVNYHNNNKKCGQLAYEFVLQFGNSFDLGKEYYSSLTSDSRRAEIRTEYTQVYTKWFQMIQKRFPHLKMLYAYIHFDEPEGTPHMHICFTPLANNYMRGLSHRISLSNALDSDGIERPKSRADTKTQVRKFFEVLRKEIQEPVLQDLGYELASPKETHREHLTCDIYKEITEPIRKDTKEMIHKLVDADEKYKKYIERINAMDKQLNDKNVELKNKERQISIQSQKIEILTNKLVELKKAFVSIKDEFLLLTKGLDKLKHSAEAFFHKPISEQKKDEELVFRFISKNKAQADNVVNHIDNIISDFDDLDDNNGFVKER